jgi:hypothetical protein
MAVQIHRAGKCTVSVDLADGNGLVALGVAQDMPVLSDEAFWHDVPGDAHGGPQGPMIDTQYLGKVIHGRIEMSRFDNAVYERMKSRLANNAAGGTVADADIGRLMIQESKTIRVLFSSANRVRNFPIALVRDTIELPQGTKYSPLLMIFEAHRNQTTGVIEDTVPS